MVDVTGHTPPAWMLHRVLAAMEPAHWRCAHLAPPQLQQRCSHAARHMIATAHPAAALVIHTPCGAKEAWQTKGAKMQAGRAKAALPAALCTV